LEDMNGNNADCRILTEITASALSSDTLRHLLSTVQRNNLLVCIQYSIDYCWRRYCNLGALSLSASTSMKIAKDTMSWFPHLWYWNHPNYEYRPRRRHEDEIA